jgi:hypothetical protein
LKRTPGKAVKEYKRSREGGKGVQNRKDCRREGSEIFGY